MTKPWTYRLNVRSAKRVLRTRADFIRTIRWLRRKVYDLEFELAKIKSAPPPPKPPSKKGKKRSAAAAYREMIARIPLHTKTRKSR